MAGGRVTGPKGRRSAALAATLIGAAVLSLCAAPPALAADSVYWANRFGATISFAGLDGSGGGDLATTGATMNGPFGIAIDAAAGRVYWPNVDGNKISYAKLDGTGGGDLNTGVATVNGPVGVAIDPTAGRIYWSNHNSTKISFAKLDGSGGGDLPTGGATVTSPFGVAIDPAAGRIYWASSTTISFAKLDGTGGGDLPTTGATVSHPVGVAIDPTAGRIYWANFTTNNISYANVDGTGGADLTTTGATVSGPEGVAIDPTTGRIYWANPNANKISFANLDGTGGADLATTGATKNFPTFPALLKAPAGNGAPAVSGGSTVGSTLSCSTGSWAADLLSEFLYRAPAGFAYQWRLGGADIAGATDSTITASAPGDYSCRVTATNHAGSTAQTSDAHAVLATLTVSPAGSGSGTVTGTGISCPPDCSESYAAGTAVTLTASPASGSSFAGWGGDCAGTGLCQLQMGANHAVGATFDPVTPAAPTPTPTPVTPAAGAPNTKLTGAKISSKKRTATFRFRALGSAGGFRCELKREHKPAKFKSCRSPKTYKHLKPARYTFLVRAVGPGGADPSPAKKSFKIGK